MKGGLGRWLESCCLVLERCWTVERASRAVRSVCGSERPKVELMTASWPLLLRPPHQGPDRARPCSSSKASWPLWPAACRSSCSFAGSAPRALRSRPSRSRSSSSATLAAVRACCTTHTALHDTATRPTSSLIAVSSLSSLPLPSLPMWCSLASLPLRYRLQPAKGPRRRPARPLHLPRDARRLGQHPPAAPLRPPPPAQGRRRRMVPLARPHRHPGRARLPLRPGTSTLRYLATCDRRADASPARPQNPPAIPTLAIVKVAALVRGSRVIVDWHNTGYSVLALRLGERHPVVRLAKLCVPLSLSPSRSHELALTYLVTAIASSSCSVGQHTRTCACRMP